MGGRLRWAGAGALLKQHLAPEWMKGRREILSRSLAFCRCRMAFIADACHASLSRREKRKVSPALNTAEAAGDADYYALDAKLPRRACMYAEVCFVYQVQYVCRKTWCSPFQAVNYGDVLMCVDHEMES